MPETHLFKGTVKCLDQLLLQESDHFLNIPRANHVQRDFEGFPSHVKVGTANDAQDVHNELIEDMFVLLVKEGDAGENDRLDVV